MRRATRAEDVPPLRLLCVDADASTASWLDVALIAAAAERVQIDHVDSTREALALLGDAPYDVALVAISADGEVGLDALAAIQELSAEVAPVALLEVSDLGIAVRAIRAGAQDAIVRGRGDAEALSRALRFAVERQRVRTVLHTRTLVDDLTGLYNRRGFISLARQHVKTAERLSRDLVHVFLDVDGMKQINDTFGHREGDLALIESADILRATFRESDVIARMGGDEFAVMAMETSSIAETTVVERLRAQLKAHNDRGHRPYALSFSIGTTRHIAGSPCELDELLLRADRMMYEQKRSRFATPSPVAALPQIPLEPRSRIGG